MSEHKEFERGFASNDRARASLEAPSETEDESRGRDCLRLCNAMRRCYDPQRLRIYRLEQSDVAVLAVRRAEGKLQRLAPTIRRIDLVLPC